LLADAPTEVAAFPGGFSGVAGRGFSQCQSLGEDSVSQFFFEVGVRDDVDGNFEQGFELSS
jgi:hypothetical protein